MQGEPGSSLSDQDVFDLFQRAREQYERYMEINAFHEFSVFDVQEEQCRHIDNSWGKPLGFCFFKERKNAIME